MMFDVLAGSQLEVRVVWNWQTLLNLHVLATVESWRLALEDLVALWMKVEVEVEVEVVGSWRGIFDIVLKSQIEVDLVRSCLLLSVSWMRGCGCSWWERGKRVEVEARDHFESSCLGREEDKRT